MRDDKIVRIKWYKICIYAWIDNNKKMILVKFMFSWLKVKFWKYDAYKPGIKRTDASLLCKQNLDVVYIFFEMFVNNVWKVYRHQAWSFYDILDDTQLKTSDGFSSSSELKIYQHNQSSQWIGFLLEMLQKDLIRNIPIMYESILNFLQRKQRKVCMLVRLNVGKWAAWHGRTL